MQNEPLNQATETVIYDDKTIRKIVGGAVSQVDGVLGPAGGMFSGLTDAFKHEEDVDYAQGIIVDQNDSRIDIRAKLIVEMGKSIPAVSDQVGEAVHQAVRAQTTLEVGELEIEIADAMTQAEYEHKFRKTKQEAAKS